MSQDSSRRGAPAVKSILVALIGAAAAGIAASQGLRGAHPGEPSAPEAEFHMARMVYTTRGCGGSRGFCNPWWAVDYPEAEANFLPALSRLTNIAVAPDSRHLPLTDDRIFDYPWLFVQQVARGNWQLDSHEVARLREYLLRGGFMVVDDFHGQAEWRLFEEVIRQVLPDRPIVDVQADSALMNIFYELDLETQIPGARHLGGRWGGGRGREMQGPPEWRGIFDEHGRLMVAINFNVDMGDAWEHADDAFYPTSMTAMAYRFGVNYVVYAMTH